MMERSERIKVILLVVFIFLLFLLLPFLSTKLIQKQIVWNQFKETCSIKDSARLEGNIAVGVERMLRGDVALGVLQKLDPGVKMPAEGKEYLLVSFALKNFAKLEQNIEPIEVSAKVQGLPDQKERSYDPIDFSLPSSGEFQRFDTAVLYQPGEVRKGAFCFEIQKSYPVDHFFMMKPFFGTIWIEKPIDLNSNLVLLFLFVLYLLSLFGIIILSFQRKRRSNGKKEFFYILVVLGFLHVLSCFYYWYAGLPIWFLIIFILLLIFIITLLYFKRRGVLLDFNFLTKKDRLKLIDDFEEKMGWAKTTKMEIRKCIEVFNPSNQDSYKFYRGSSVYVNHPTEDTIKAKKVLLDLYCATKFDWVSFLWTILILNAWFIYIILTHFSETY